MIKFGKKRREKLDRVAWKVCRINKGRIAVFLKRDDFLKNLVSYSLSVWFPNQTRIKRVSYKGGKIIWFGLNEPEGCSTGYWSLVLWTALEKTDGEEWILRGVYGGTEMAKSGSRISVCWNRKD